MSVFLITMDKGRKKMRPISTREEYLALRNSATQIGTVAKIRFPQADTDVDRLKRSLLQFNYSCLPNEDGSLKGATRVGNSVGMDIDHIPAEEMKPLIERILAKKDELGLLLLEKSARGEGLHTAFKRHLGMSNEENLRWASDLLGVEYDKGAKDITRVFFATTASEEDLLFLDDAIFDNNEAENGEQIVLPLTKEAKAETEAQGSDAERKADAENKAKAECKAVAERKAEAERKVEAERKMQVKAETDALETDYQGIPYDRIIRKWWELYNEGKEPVTSNRDVLTFELAVNLRHICGFNRNLMAQVIPCYDGFPVEQKMKCIDSALAEKRTQMPKRLREVLEAVRYDMNNDEALSGDKSAGSDNIDELLASDDSFYYDSLPKMPQGIRDSIEAVGPALSMPVITAICPAIGMLATGVKVDIHRKMSSLNLISYIAGDFASGKGSIDPVVEAWTSEVKAMDKMYQQQEDEWRAKKRAAKNKKDQPEEPKLPVRCLTLNNTVANLAERLANTEGKHAFSFTPEADTVAQKWKSSMSDFSVMLRQAYDASPYEREARSAEAVNVHIDHLKWNVVMCGTPDALYRVVTSYTDGFQSRIAVARTPDNTFSALNENLHVMSDRQAERIRQIAHLLPLMEGEVVLSKLEEKGCEWLERIRLETVKNDDKIRARQRFRICPTTMRMMTCLMLCRVAEQLIAKHGLQGAETRLKQKPDLWKEMIVKTQTPSMLAVFDILADYQLENALYFFRDRIESAFESRDYCGSTHNTRQRRSKNDTIFERLAPRFTFEQALQQSIIEKGASATRNSVYQMLKNWRKSGMIGSSTNSMYIKL